MSVVVTATSAGILAGSGASRTISYTHVAGNDLCVIVLWRSPSITLSSVTYNGASMTLIVASGQSDADPGPSASAYRINDPGGMTANLVINYTSGTPSFINAYILDVAGCPATSPIDSSGSALWSGAGDVIETHSRINTNTMTVISGIRTRGASVTTFTADEGETELFDEDNGLNPGISTSLYTLQETASGSLARGVTASTNGKYALVCFSYITASSGQPMSKRLGLIPGCRRIQGVW